MAWVEDYLARERPDVACWNYDKNDEKRTIETFHVHIYFCTDARIAPRLQMCAGWGTLSISETWSSEVS